MDTNINSDIKFVSAHKRSAAASIDITIVAIIRIFAAQLIGALWINKMIADFLLEFRDHFGTEVIKSDPSHIEFITHHKIFHSMIIFYFIIVMIGAVYHSYLNSSMWQGTIGKRIMKIMIISDEGKKISFLNGLAHYFLSLLPFVFIIYLAAYQNIHQITFFAAILDSKVNIFFSALTAIWVQAHIFTKKKTTIYDLICRTIFIEGKTQVKFPWK